MKTPEAAQNSLTQAAKACLQEHSKEKFSPEKIAGALFVNGSYLLRLFRHETGMTLPAYHHIMFVVSSQDFPGIQGMQRLTRFR